MHQLSGARGAGLHMNAQRAAAAAFYRDWAEVTGPPEEDARPRDAAGVPQGAAPDRRVFHTGRARVTHDEQSLQRATEGGQESAGDAVLHVSALAPEAEGIMDSLRVVAKFGPVGVGHQGRVTREGRVVRIERDPQDVALVIEWTHPATAP